MSPLLLSPRLRSAALAAVVAAIGLSILLLDLFDAGWFTWPYRLAGLMLLLAAIVLLYVAKLRDWGRADEVVQTAHKSSVFWGSMIGLGIWMLLIWSPWPVELATLLASTYGNLEPARLAALAGGLMLAACAFAGYAVSLVAWWMARR